MRELYTTGQASISGNPHKKIEKLKISRRKLGMFRSCEKIRRREQRRRLENRRRRRERWRERER